jgi:hypothetical protein
MSGLPLLRALLLVGLLAGTAGCKDAPGADGRYATHDGGRNNNGGGLRGLPVTPYGAP